VDIKQDLDSIFALNESEVEYDNQRVVKENGWVTRLKFIADWFYNLYTKISRLLIETNMTLRKAG
jgi:hypothetical protein